MIIKKENYYKVLNKIFDIKKIGRMAIIESQKKNNKYFLNLNEYILWTQDK
jgi:hypothetical protein